MESSCVRLRLTLVILGTFVLIEAFAPLSLSPHLLSVGYAYGLGIGGQGEMRFFLMESRLWKKDVRTKQSAIWRRERDR